MTLAPSSTDSAAPRVSHAGGRRARSRLLTAALVTLLLVGALLVWRGLSPQAPPPAPLPAHTFGAVPSGDGRATPAPGAADARTPAPVQVPTYGPDRLGIPSLGVDAPTVPEGLRGDGQLVIPGDPSTVGRWTGGAAPGATAGTMLLAGHVAIAGVGAGALEPLYRIEQGALVVTTDAHGTATRWRVVALEVRGKDDVPTFRADGPLRLALVTCGGELLQTPAGRSYADNVIAWAEPA